MKQNLVYTDGLKALQKRMELMYNNKDHSDTVFIVNAQKFFVSRQLIAVASKKLDAVMSEYFTYCDDGEIKLHAVKCEESFSIVLKYMYGLDVNFGETKVEVLCDVIRLAETFQLDQFCKDLQCHLSKLDEFDIDSLAVLLNTARKYNLNELYERLQVFAFENAEQFVKHDSIVSLLYEVLLDLIKSDWFCAPEIEILTGVLNWHMEMNTKESKSIDGNDDTQMNTKDNKCIGEELDTTSEAGSSVCDSLTSSSNMKPIETNTVEGIQDLEQEEVKETDEDNVDKHNSNMEPAEIAEQKLKCSELKKSFSENVLKSLLPHVRGKQILWFDIVALHETNLYETYKHVLRDTKLFSQNNDLRRKYVPTARQATSKDVTVTTGVTTSAPAFNFSNWGSTLSPTAPSEAMTKAPVPQAAASGMFTHSPILISKTPVSEAVFTHSPLFGSRTPVSEAVLTPSPNIFGSKTKYF
uniref:BTB/POZ domain-containing protein 9 n=1 Tax=Cacopsylla melanoneura TaxID=428564 RepID=A0A8D8XKN0_9HEMI